MTTPPSAIAAHGHGVTKLAFSKNGKKIYTAGDDCIVRIWDPNGGADQEPKIMTEAQESVTALDTSSDGWVAGGEDSSVRRYSSSTDEMVGTVTQTGGMPVRCVAFNPKGDKLVIGSDDLAAKIVDVNDTLQCHLLEGHTKGLRAATWHPSGTQLTTSGQDGKIIVWDCSNWPPTILHELDDLIPACSETAAVQFSYSAAATWHPSGNYFVVASQTHDIAVISRNNWKKTGVYPTEGHASDITALAFSANGLYLASAGKDGKIVIWNTESKKAICRHKVETGLVIDIAWSSITNLLAWTDMDGALVRWKEPVPSQYPSPFTRPTPANAVPQNRSKKPADAKLQALLDDGDDTAMDGDDDLAAVPGDDEEDEDWVENDLGEDFVAKERFNEGTREMVNVTKAQSAFQPGSTPFRGKKRYLAFNSIGSIDVSDQDIHHVINIEFHDRSLRRGHHFQDVFKFTMASLGERGVAFACPSGAQHAAFVSYRPYDSWASNSEWQVSLLAGENPVAIAAGGLPYSNNFDVNDLGGDGYLAVATSRGYVRFFSGGGVQKYIWTVGGDVVTMAAGAEWTFVIHREGGTSLDGCQNLRYTLISSESFDIIQAGYLPLPRGTVLSWIGITTEGAPTICDSTGVISVMDRFRRPTQGRWVPAVDTNLLARKVGKDESYWPVGLSGKELLCIILKGGDTQPGFPRPMIQDIEVQMPLLDMETPQGQAEERFLREALQTSWAKDAGDASSTAMQRQELDLDKTLIQMIQLACKSDRLQRALDITSLLHHSASYDSAQKLAGFYKLAGLQEKIGVLKQRKFDHDGEGEGDIDPRKGWGKVTEPIGRGYSSGGGGRQGRMEMFDDFRPPPVATRATLALARPVGEVPFVRPAASTSAARPTVLPPDESSMEVDMESSFSYSDMDSLPTNGKRKLDSEISAWDGAGAAKKRSNGTAMATSTTVPFAAPSNGVAKAPGNPFAKKPGTDAAKNNPFAKNAGNSKSIVKSTSFFDKVDEADAAGGKKSKGKEKETSKGKQATLAYFRKPAPTEKKKTTKEVASKETDGEMAEVMSTAADLYRDSQVEGETQEDSQLEGDTQEETQMEDDDTQITTREESPDWNLDDGDAAAMTDVDVTAATS